MGFSSGLILYPKRGRKSRTVVEFATGVVEFLTNQG
jgi:hypothetical protein